MLHVSCFSNGYKELWLCFATVNMSQPKSADWILMSIVNVIGLLCVEPKLALLADADPQNVG